MNEHSSGGTPAAPRHATLEIVGYHVVGPEDDHLKGDGGAYASLASLVHVAGGESVEWGVLEAHCRQGDGTELGPFAAYLDTPLPSKKRYRLTVEIFDV